MNQQNTAAIVLARTNYGEADRIVTVLSPDYGRLRLMAKGVRKVKSKLAGGIELFSVSHITFIKGRGDISTLVSARLERHYGKIVNDIVRVQLGYDLIKLLNKTIEDEAEKEYFELLEHTLQALDDLATNDELIRIWFLAQLLRLGGHMPNLQTDSFGEKLNPHELYEFDYDAMAFVQHDQGQFTPDHIKFTRLIFSGNPPSVLRKVTGSGRLTDECTPPISNMFIQLLDTR
jgi:DNA repair protein RecO (recombination protein O)